jgi:hypothetical protein
MKNEEQGTAAQFGRRGFVTAALMAGVSAISARGQQTGANGASTSPPQPKLRIQTFTSETAKITPAVRNAIELGNRLVSWQSPYGAPDPVKCPYRTPGPFGPTQLHTTGPATRALYRLFDAVGIPEYKSAADRYAVFHLSTLRDPYEPHYDETNLTGAWNNRLSRSWLYGKGLSPCYEYFRIHNPGEDGLDIKAYACYRWLQKYRREEGYFGIGYGAGDAPDGQFSCDLGEVGSGLVGFYKLSRYQPALDDAIGLARFFLTEWREGSGRGVWSSSVGTWLLGPWPGIGGEHVTNQAYAKSGWGWSAYVDGEFLLRLYSMVGDASLRAAIAEKCLRSLRWCFDACQFDDGAHGMFGRDDKWVGMAAGAILLYAEARKSGILSKDFEKLYAPRLEKSWGWLLANTGRDTYPPDGYIRGNGATSKKPPENIVWLMAWTIEALLVGNQLVGR